MTNSLDLSSNILHMNNDISETISKTNCLRICYIALKLPGNFLALALYNAQISVAFKIFGEYFPEVGEFSEPGEFIEPFLTC